MGERVRFERSPYPWQGLVAGLAPPRLLHVSVEISPFDAMIFEIDEQTGFLRLDRP